MDKKREESKLEQAGQRTHEEIVGIIKTIQEKIESKQERTSPDESLLRFQ